MKLDSVPSADRQEILILIPFYNEEKYIKRCLESLVNQSFETYKVILSDNGSTDKSSEIVQEIISGDGRFILNTRSTKMSGDENWNFLFQKAVEYRDSFKYMMWFSADDYWLDSSCLSQLVLGASADDGVDCVIPRFMNTSESGKLDYEHFFDSDICEGSNLNRLVNLGMKWANCVAIYGLYKSATFVRLGTKSVSKINSDPESDWWWTYSLIKNFKTKLVREAVYVKTIKEQPYYLERGNRRRIPAFQLVRQAFYRGLTFNEFLMVIAISILNISIVAKQKFFK